MSTRFLELHKDQALKFRLFIILIAFASITCAIYAVITYRIAYDMGTKSAQQETERQIAFISNELQEDFNSYQKRLPELLDILKRSNSLTPQQMLQIDGEKFHWRENRQVPERVVSLALDQKAKENLTHQHTLIEYQNHHYIWVNEKLDGNQFFYIKRDISLDNDLLMIKKRLTITSLIVLWIATWAAIILSKSVSKRVESKNAALRYLATHDKLTDLPNRLYLMDLLTEQFDSDAQKKDENFKPMHSALLILDLNNFKEVNNAFGHDAGDNCLKDVTTRFLQMLPENHQLIRSEGDEFIIWAPNCSNKEAVILAANLSQIVSEPCLINELSWTMSANIGIAIYPDHANASESLLKKANLALYEAKDKQRPWMVYDHTSNSDENVKIRLRSDLGHVFARQELELYYQPKVALENGKIIGVEALARWNHPSEGLITPDQFIPLIEKNGFTQALGRYVIEKAIVQLAKWQQEDIHTNIAINLSPYNLLDPTLLNYVKELLHKYQVPAHALEIELTETATSIEIQNISKRLEAFKVLGIRIAIDDFGTSMSSLSYISHLNADVIKVDRSFISDIESNDNHKAITNSAINLCKSFNSTSVAEGVETIEQLRILKVMGCEVGQGYYFSKPIPEEKISQLLKQSTLFAVS